MHPALKTWLPSEKNPWDFDAAAHLMRRAGFGDTPERVESIMRIGPENAVIEVVKGPRKDSAIDELEAIYPAIRGSGSVESARKWLLTRMLRSDYPLREKMGLFWHGHFATSIRKVRDVDWMMRQYRLFLDHGMVSFPKLLAGVARDPAMIRWLDNETNSKGKPNENFARELFELFTLGDGNYTEADIQEAGRAFTGWHILRDEFHFSKSQHDTGTKNVLGRSGNFGGDDILKIALEQKACGNFLAGKLLRYFVMPDPPSDLVEALGAVLRDSGYDISATLTVMFRSRAFFDPAVRRSLVKSPVEYVIGSARCMEMEVKVSELLGPMREMGQDLLDPPNVKGWPGGRTWINTATWITRVNAAHKLTRDWDPPLSGATAAATYGRALLGRAPDARVQKVLLDGGTGKRDLVHGLLALPEAHLN